MREEVRQGRMNNREKESRNAGNTDTGGRKGKGGEKLKWRGEIRKGTKKCDFVTQKKEERNDMHREFVILSARGKGVL